MPQYPHFKLAMPPDVRAWLDVEAPKHGRSRTMHIIFLLRQEMKKETEESQFSDKNSSASQQ